jgi:hypothetical protein
LRPFIESKKLKGKRAVVVVPSEEGAEAQPQRWHVHLVPKDLEMNLIGALLPGF